MEEHEEKRKKRRRTKSSSISKSTTSIPLDLTSEILSRLPIKSIVRFRCVSKQWSSIITDPYFTNSFKKTKSPKKPNLLLCFKEGDELFVFSIPQHRHYATIDRYHMKFPLQDYFSVSESVQGLICFEESGKAIVWNPTTGQFLTLPEPEMRWKKIKFFLGYDPIEGKHKVVCMPQGVKNCNEYKVLTLGSAQKSWRSIKTNYMEYPDFTASSNGRCINGVVYCEVCGQAIMRFNVRSEKMDTIELPFSKFCETLMSYEGRLACVEKNYTNKLWILEDTDKKREWRWNEEFSAPFVHVDHSLSLILKGITDDGEFIYAPNGFYQSFNCILFGDPVRYFNRFRKVYFKEIVNDEFRLRHGLGNGHSYVLHSFPNHIENLMFL